MEELRDEVNDKAQELGNYLVGAANMIFNNGDTSKGLPDDVEITLDENGWPTLHSPSSRASVSFVIIDYGNGEVNNSLTS